MTSENGYVAFVRWMEEFVNWANVGTPPKYLVKSEDIFTLLRPFVGC
ncbi:MAG: hypothetical protein M2R45_03773 [Verrucomicrobia subdivision 3 bacterium]|nr:hypothetical protein [Limisphaerales bacterium]MCS1416786.1 hypothetical protein [Limisphaerales bacterium]